LLHDIYASHPRESGLALGLAFGLVRPLVGGARHAVLHLHLAADGQEIGLPYAPGLSSFGLDPSRVIFGRLSSLSDLLWAMEEALGCRAVAAVIADLATPPKGLDFTASRRLSMRAASSGASALIIRYGQDRAMSAAHLRWAVSPALTQPQAFDARAPGRPRFLIELERSRLGQLDGRVEGTRLLVDWTHHGFICAETVTPDRSPADRDPQRVAPPSGSVSAPLGHGLSQTG
jgi:protein ImuA